MAKNSGPPAFLYIFVFLVLAGMGYWYFSYEKASQPLTNNVSTPNATAPETSASSSTTQQQTAPTFPMPASVAAGTTVRIDGSTSMVTINQNLKNGFESKFPGTQVVTIANGSGQGIQALISGSADVAAVSRPLTPGEISQGLVAVPIALDQIAIVVGKDNPFRTGLASRQVQQIFQGQITDWSQLGSNPGTIRAINRPPISGTHQGFKELVLNRGNFGTTANITTMQRDATTPMLRELKNDGIGYATYAQVATQQTVRVVAIDGLTPEAESYPYKRILFYVYKNPPTPAVSAFLGYTQSPVGQQAIFSEN